MEANRLLWQWCHPKSSNMSPWHKRQQAYQGAIRRARQYIDQPPQGHKDWGCLGPWSCLGSILGA